MYTDWSLHPHCQYSRTVVLKPQKFHTCIHRTLCIWKNKMCVVNFILFILIAQKSLAVEPLKLTHQTPGVRSNLG